MKLLLDNNLSPKLVARLEPLYPGTNHVALLGLDRATDLDVWDHAGQNNYCLVTKGSDFNEILASRGFPPRVIWIRLGNCTTSEIFTLLDAHRGTILEFGMDPLVGLLELQ